MIDSRRLETEHQFLGFFNSSLVYCENSIVSKLPVMALNDLLDVSSKKLREMSQKCVIAFRLIKDQTEFVGSLYLEKVQAHFEERPKTICLIQNVDLRPLHIHPLGNIHLLPKIFISTQKSSEDAEEKESLQFEKLELPSSAEEALFLKSGQRIGLSREMQDGINGKRGADHQIPLLLLTACAEKKRNAFTKMKSYENIPLHFRVQTKTSYKVLNVVFKKFPKETSPFYQIQIVTAYYMGNASLENATSLSGAKLAYWIASLPTVPAV